MAPIVASKLQRKTIDRCGALLSCKSWLRGAISHDFHGFLPRNFNFFSAGAEQCLETWERKNGCMSLGSPPSKGAVGQSSVYIDRGIAEG